MELEYLELDLLNLFQKLHPALLDDILENLHRAKKDPEARQPQEPVSLGGVEMPPGHPKEGARNGDHKNPHAHRRPFVSPEPLFVVRQKGCYFLLVSR